MVQIKFSLKHEWILLYYMTAVGWLSILNVSLKSLSKHVGLKQYKYVQSNFFKYFCVQSWV